MSKRSWILILMVATLSAILAGCGGGELAEDLTPIPTLPPGETPTLIAALPGEEVEAQDGTEEAVAPVDSAEGTAEAEDEDEPAAEGTAEAGAGDGGGDTAAEGDPAEGEALFASNCAGCHGAEPGAGPPLSGMGARAEDAVEDLSAAEYLHQSIVDPSAHIVEGYADIMPKDYEERFDEQQLNDLVAFLLTQ